MGLGSDQTIWGLKARKTINNNAERLYMVRAIKFVKDAWINSGNGIMDFEKEVIELKPDIFFVNTDGYTPAKLEFCKKHGIDTDVFRPYDQNEMKAQFGWQNKKILLGVASTWTQRKGLNDFISLSQERPSEYRIVLVGVNDKQKKNLPPNITAISRTESTAELARLYSAADVFVTPTWEDNYPTTNLEAISCGTPVVTYHTGGSPESVKENNGAVVAKGNLSQLKEAVTNIRKDTASCREYALKHFRMQDRFGEYVELYKQILND